MRLVTSILCLLGTWPGFALWADWATADDEAPPSQPPSSSNVASPTQPATPVSDGSAEAIDRPPPPARAAVDTRPGQGTVRDAIKLSSKDKVGGDGIETTLDAIKIFKDSGRLSRARPALPTWTRFKANLARRHGLEVGIAYTLLYQHASASDGPADAAGGDFDILGRWHLTGTPSCSGGYLNFLLEGRHRLGTTIPPGGLGRSVGSLWNTSLGFNEQPFIPKQVYWEQELDSRGSKILAGLIDPAIYFFGTRATDQNQLFLNAMFSDDPTAATPSAGLGAVIQYWPSKQVLLKVGAADANGSRTDDPYGDFLNGEFYYAAEITFQAHLPHLGLGNYRLGAWHSDARKMEGKQAGGGFALNFDQDFGQDVIVFGQYSRGFDGLKATRQLLRGGIGVWSPFGDADDLLGFGFGWGEPTDRALGSQMASELFYRIQLAPYLQLTPSLQWISGPSLAPARRSVGLLGLRLRLTI